MTEENRARAESYLALHEDTAMFLLGNLESFGPRAGPSANSGNFKLLLQGYSVVGVFCLAQRGNLLIQSSAGPGAHPEILHACREEPTPLKGLLGEWGVASALWDALKSGSVIVRETFASKEILFSLEPEDHTAPPADPRGELRLLVETDFKAWKPLRIAFTAEEGIANDLTDAQLHAQFLSSVDRRVTWGLFENGKLVSVAALNAKTRELGQVGGVYTVPSHRRRGLSRRTMEKLLYDSKHLHQLRKIILFTGEKNFPAQKLYESLSFARIGHYGIFFGDPAGAQANR